MNEQKLFEMAKAAQERMLDRLPTNKKYVFLLGRFFELKGDHNTKNALKKYLGDRLTEEEFNWDNIVSVVAGGNEDDIAAINRGAHTDTMAEKFHAKFDTLYNNMKNSLARSKDNIDTNYVDKVLDFYSKVYNHEDTAENLFNQLNMQPVVDWIKANEGEAAERFGRRWPKIQRLLAQWLDDNYEGSINQTIATFWDWWRTVPREDRETAKPSVELAQKLAKIFCREDSREILGNYHNFVLKKTLLTLTSDGNVVPNGLKAALGNAVRNGAEFGRMTDFCENLVNTWFDTLNPTEEQIEEMRNRPDDDNGEININNYADRVAEEIPNDAADMILAAVNYEDNNHLQTLQDALKEFADNDMVDINMVGHVDKNIVREAFAYYRQLGRTKRVGRTSVFSEETLNSIQAFYNEFKNLFKIGLKLPAIKSLLVGYADARLDAINRHDNDYWNNRQFEDVPEEYELEEALRVLHKHGLMIA